MTRRLSVAALGAALAVGVSGCGADPLPAPKPQVDPAAVAVVEDAQVERVLAETAAVLAAGDAAGDAAPLPPRVDGAALQLRQGGYAVRRVLPDQPAPAPLGGELVLDLPTAAGGWPRFFLTVTQAAPDAVPKLELHTQAAPREPYRLSAYATLLPGTTLPSAEPGVPAEALPAAEPSGLVAAPADVVARYADVLTNGAASPNAVSFAEDPFRAQVIAEQDAERAAAGEFVAYQASHTPRADAVWSLRTEDGGAIVIGVLDALETYEVTAEGAVFNFEPQAAALAGAGQVTGSATVNRTEIVAFAVPAEGSDQPIAVLGAERGIVAAQAS